MSLIKYVSIGENWLSNNLTKFKKLEIVWKPKLGLGEVKVFWYLNTFRL